MILNKRIKVEELVVWEDDSQDFSEGELKVIRPDLRMATKSIQDNILVEFVHGSRSLNVGKVSTLETKVLDTLTIPNHKHTLFKYNRDELPKTIAWSFTTI